MRKIIKIKSILSLLFIYSNIVFANNVLVENVTLKGLQPNAGFTLVSFDLSWENSWRLNTASANWDAAWVFVKFRKQSGPWQHATLNYVNGQAAVDGHQQATGSIIETTSDGKGAFIYRSDVGAGDVNWTTQLRWNYGADGVNVNTMLEVKVFAIEMVYVPEGSYLLGGGDGQEVGKFFTWGSVQDTEPYGIKNEGEITIAKSSGSLFYNLSANHSIGDQTGPVPSDFPKGYNAFYCMKYEVTQSQWVDFFNTLEPAQQINNDLTDLDHKGPNKIDRNSIAWENTGGATTGHPNIPVSFIEWSEVLAYSDWAGLRPMTELEYVKACRGPEPVVAESYAWGTNSIVGVDYPYNIKNRDNENEQVLNPASEIGNSRGLSFEYFTDGAWRSGIFAASSYTGDRVETGASYYGIMEMTGNLYEMAVTIGTRTGRAFQGNHGDGVLTIDGEADVPFWQLGNGGIGGLFGGSWFSEEGALWLNDRRSATSGNVGYFTDVGFRCVRTAPSN